MKHTTNWAAAFVAFSNGTSLEEIAQSMAIPFGTLKTKAHNEAWARLTRQSVAVPTRADVAERDLAKIESNRAENLRLAEQLRGDAAKLITELLAGTLKVQKVMSTGITVQVDPSIRDRKDLVDYLRGITDLTYRALGDAPAAAAEGPTGTPAAPITIILPTQVALPRSNRVQVLEHPCVTVEVLPAGQPVPIVTVDSNDGLSR